MCAISCKCYVLIIISYLVSGGELRKDTYYIAYINMFTPIAFKAQLYLFYMSILSNCENESQISTSTLRKLPILSVTILLARVVFSCKEDRQLLQQQNR